MKEETNKRNIKEKDSLLYDGSKKQENKYLVEYNNRTSTSLSYHIVYNREGELFDSPEVRERDLELQADTGETTIAFRDDNKNIVNLSNNQMRVIYGLSKILSYQIEQKEVESNIRAQSYKDLRKVPKTINIEELTKIIYSGSCRTREKEEVIKELYKLDKLRQHFTLKTSSSTTAEFTSPIIKILETYNETNEKGENLHLMNLYFGWVFYHNLENKFTLLPPQLFEYWEQGELFPVLFASLQIAQRTCIASANKVEKRLKKEEATKEEIQKAREEQLSYELNFSNIQERIETDYSRKPQRFIQQLEKCIDAFKKMKLIKGAKIAKGKKGQSKVIFYILDKKELLELTE